MKFMIGRLIIVYDIALTTFGSRFRNNDGAWKISNDLVSYSHLCFPTWSRYGIRHIVTSAPASRLLHRYQLATVQ